MMRGSPEPHPYSFSFPLIPLTEQQHQRFFIDRCLFLDRLPFLSLLQLAVLLRILHLTSYKDLPRLAFTAFIRSINQ
jgi:hypothetical protein